MDFTYKNLSYFNEYGLKESQKIFIKRNFLLISALEKFNDLTLERAEILVNIYLNNQFYKVKYPVELYKESFKYFHFLDKDLTDDVKEDDVKEDGVKEDDVKEDDVKEAIVIEDDVN